MPPGTPFNSFALPYRIRVDAFTQLPSHEVQPALYLLTHTHTDHVTGLGSKSFGSVVHCSRDAKEMLLRHESLMERQLFHEMLRSGRIRTYSHLKVDPVAFLDGSQHFVGARNLLKPLPMNTPTTIELEHGEEVIVTLIDANHCPGAVMYLVEGRKGAVLHTGDFRAEPWFLENLARNPYLQPYLAPLTTRNDSFVNKPLDAIYLDTACAFSTIFVPTKEQATAGLVELIKHFPSDTHFFINSWTWGYEDILKSIARAFQCQIHVDRYKYSVYQHVSDPYLRAIVTMEEASTRFHACERFRRCGHVIVHQEPIDPDVPARNRTGKQVVYINPVTMPMESWETYQDDIKQRLLVGEAVNSLLVPLSRHSPLPELQAFVRLFRPMRVIPNTLDTRLHGLDWICLDRMFEACLSSLVSPSVSPNKIPATPHGAFNLDMLTIQVDEEGDAAVQNAIGSSESVLRWVDKGKLRNKLDIMIGYLDPDRRTFLDKLVRVGSASPTPPAYASRLLVTSPAPHAPHVSILDKDSEYGSDSDVAEEEHWKAAHFFFADSSGSEGKLLSKVFFPQDEPNKEPEVAPAVKRYCNDHRSQVNAQVMLPMPPSTPPVRHVVGGASLQGRKSPSGVKRTRASHDSLGTSGSSKRLMTEGQKLAFPIHIPTSSKAANSVVPRRAAIRPHNDDNVASISSSSESEEPAKSIKRLGSSHDIRHSLRWLGVHRPSAPGQPYAAQDENVFASDFLDKPSLEQPLSHLQSSPRPCSPKWISAASASHAKHATKTIISINTHAEQPLEAIAYRKKRVKRTLQSLELADKLARANPGKVAHTYHESRARLLSDCVRRQIKTQYLEALQKSDVPNVIPDSHFTRHPISLNDFETVDGSQMTVDWNRSAKLAEVVRKSVGIGIRPGVVIPPLFYPPADDGGAIGPKRSRLGPIN